MHRPSLRALARNYEEVSKAAARRLHRHGAFVYAGYDIREEEGLEATIEVVRRTVGLKNVRAVHFNDSRAPYNSRVDRHWHIGEGHIGRDALRRFAQHPRWPMPPSFSKLLTMIRGLI
jgi:endonuclease IV